MTNYTSIDWAEISWNPCPGCLNDCYYCYARHIALTRLQPKGCRGYEYGFEPNLVPEKLKNPVPKKDPAPTLVFVCSMGELFGDWMVFHHIRRKWIELVLKVVRETPQHCFLFLTKFPLNMVYVEKQFGIVFPRNAWLGTTVTTQKDLWRMMVLNDVSFKHPHVKFVSFEPLLGEIVLVPWIVENINWFIIGALTKQGKVRGKQPRKVWVSDLLHVALMSGIPVLIKKNVCISGINPQHYQNYPERKLWGDFKMRVRQETVLSYYSLEELKARVPSSYILRK